MGLAGVILAAGESTRMGRDKALLPWGSPHPLKSAKGGAASYMVASGTLLSAAIQTLSQFCEMVIVVAGNNELALRPVVYSGGASLVRNPTPDLGQFSSLQAGLREVLSRGRDSAMITLVDRPPPKSETLNHLVNVFTGRERGVWAVVPEYQGKHGHPILVGREMMEAFLRAPTSASAREIEHTNQERIAYVAVADPQVALNIDTPEDYASLESRL
jgi:molybdenum cofactor cytidylyltransferase